MNTTHQTLPVVGQKSPRAIVQASSAMVVNHDDSPPVEPAHFPCHQPAFTQSDAIAASEHLRLSRIEEKTSEAATRTRMEAVADG